jgi:hypothetical protein
MATTYLVLEQVPSPVTAYAPLRRVEATSAEAAIRQVVEQQAGSDELAEVYVAVPARSWTEQAVTVESKPRISLADPPQRPTLVSDEGRAAPADATAGGKTQRVSSS